MLFYVKKHSAQSFWAFIFISFLTAWRRGWITADASKILGAWIFICPIEERVSTRGQKGSLVHTSLWILYGRQFFRNCKQFAFSDVVAFLSSFHEKVPFSSKKSAHAQWQKGRNYGFECFVRCQKARWRFERAELSRWQFYMYHLCRSLLQNFETSLVL